MKNLDNVTNVWGKVDERRHEVLEVSVQGMRNRWPLGFPLVKFRNAAGEEYAHSFKDDMQSNKVRVELNDRDVKRAGVCVMTVEWHDKGRVVASREYMGLIEGKKMEKPKYEVIGGEEDCAGGNGGGSNGGSGLPEGGEPFKQLVTDASGKTVWEDRLAYKMASETVLVDNVTIEMSDVSGLYIQNVEASGEFVADNVYKVLYDNEKYECTAYVGGEGVIGIGNAGIAGATGGNGEPFFIGGAGNGVLQVIATTGGSHTIKISQIAETIKPIDPPFLGGWKALGEGEPVRTALVDNVTFTLSSYGNFGGAYNPFEVAVEQGKEYTVVWGADEYTVIGTTSDTVDGVYIGNLGIMSPDVADTGEPFCIVAMDGVTQVISKTSGEQTVSVYAMLPEIIPVPDAYLVYQFPSEIKNAEHAAAVIAEMQKYQFVRVGNTVCFYSFYEGTDGVAFEPVTYYGRDNFVRYDAGMLVTSVTDKYPMDTSYLQTSWKQYGTALYLSTPRGKKFAIKVSDDGTLSATEVT